MTVTAGVGVGVAASGVARLIVTDCVAVPPALVAVHVNVVPAVSAVTVLVVQGGRGDRRLERRPSTSSR